MIKYKIFNNSPIIVIETSFYSNKIRKKLNIISLNPPIYVNDGYKFFSRLLIKVYEISHI